MSHCPKCGVALPLSSPVCAHCGADLSALPASQGDEAALHARMLANLRDSIPIVLARKIDTLAAKMVGQRRDVTVLSVAVSNFTAASQNLDDAEVSLLVGEMMHALADVIYKYEGTLDRLSGDTLLAMFGLPINHENDPERAVRAALEMLHYPTPLQEKLRRDYGLDLPIRIGINTGLVIAGQMGSQHHMEYTVIGDTVNAASQLAAQAEPGTARVSFRTYQRTQPVFHYEAQNSSPPSFRPLGVQARAGQARGLLGLQAPLIGREAELTRLQEAMAEVLEQRSSRVVLLSGEAGLGKTRLMQALQNSLAERPVNIFFGACASYLRITPYRVVADLLRDMIHVSEVDPQEVQREALAYALQELNLEGRDLLPYLVNVLGIAQEGPQAELRLKLLEPTMLQRQIQTALRAFLVAQAARSACLFIFDDLHWVDPASRDVLAYLIGSLEEGPILLALMARDFEAGSPGMALREAARKRRDPLIEIELAPLPGGMARQLVDRLLQTDTPRAAQVKDQIIARSGGNPYYTEELVRYLLDNGGAIRQGERWLVQEAAVELVQEVPGTLQDLILARFDRLPAPLKETLQRAAVLRGAFGLDILAQMGEEKAEHLPAQLKELEGRGFLEPTPLGQQAGWAFKHPLLQETLYNTLVKRDLRPLHLRIAQAIESGQAGLPGEISETLAYHYIESTQPARALPYLLRAAENASVRFANETALQYYRQTLELLQIGPGTKTMTAVQARIGLGRALKFTGELEEAQRVLNEALQLLEESGAESTEAPRRRLEALRELADLHARAGRLELARELLQQALDFLSSLDCPHSSPLQTQLKDRLAWVLFRQGKLTEAFDLAQAAILERDASAAEEPIALASLYNTLGGIYAARSRYPEAIECVKHSLALYTGLNYLWGMAVALTNLGVLHYSVGKWSEAISDLEAADGLRTQAGDLLERPTGLKNLGEVLIGTGDWAGAQAKFEISLEISRRSRQNLAAAYAEIGLTRLFLTQGQVENARRHLQEAQRWAAPGTAAAGTAAPGTAAAGLDERGLQILLLQAQIEAESGSLLRAAADARAALEQSIAGDFLAEQNESLALLGTLEARLGQFEAAEQHLQAGLQGTQAEDDPYRQAQCLFDLGQAYALRAAAEPAQALHWQTQAQHALQHAEVLFLGLGATPWLERVRRALQDLDPPPPTFSTFQE